MGAVNLKVTVGTVNYLDWLHVTASKVSVPATVVWEDWLDVPLSNFSFIIPNLDPENYYVRYYDAATSIALGTLVLELIVNGLTGDIISERRFYTVDGPGLYDPVDGATGVTDPYLIGKIVSGTFKEGFRYFEPDTEYTFDDTIGNAEIINGTTLDHGEKFIVEIKYKISSTNSPSGGLYLGTLNVTEATKTLLAADRDKRIRLVGTIATQVITLPTLAVLALENGFYFDNACGGTAVQVKLLTDGTDRIRFNGFMAASDLFAEFWVSKGEHLLIRKFDDDFWEVITDYKGVEVGNRQAAGYVGMPGWHAEDGSLSDGDEFGRVWWWLNVILPATHVITDDTVTDIGYIHPGTAFGQFVKHSTLKKFRWPLTQSLSEKGLANFNSYGGDVANRPVDYPGGYQAEMVGPHSHPYKRTRTDIVGANYEPNHMDGGSARGLYTGDDVVTGQNSGTNNRVENFGVIYMRHI